MKFLIIELFSTIEHALRLCSSPEDEEETFVNAVSDIEMEDNQCETYEIKKEMNENVITESIPVDTLVAALTLTGEGSEEWILARIKSHDGKGYVVEDAEVEEDPSIESVQKE